MGLQLQDPIDPIVSHPFGKYFASAQRHLAEDACKASSPKSDTERHGARIQPPIANAKFVVSQVVSADSDLQAASRHQKARTPNFDG